MIGDLTIYEIGFSQDFINVLMSGFIGFGIIVPAVILLVILSACKKYKAVTVVAGFTALVEIVCAFMGLFTISSGGFLVFVLLAAGTVGFIITAVSAYHTDKIETNMKYRPETTNQTEETTADTQQTSNNESERGGGE